MSTAPVRAAVPVAAIAIGLAAWIFLPVVGRLSLLELAALALAPPVLLGMLADRLGRRVVAAGCCWLLGIVLSAVVLRPPLQPVVLQTATVVFLLMGAALVRFVLRDGGERGRTALIAAFGAGQLVGYVLTPPESALINGVWKFAAGQAVTVLVLVVLDRYRRIGHGLAPVALVLLSGLHLVLGSRALALFTLITLAGLLVAQRRGRRLAKGRVVLLMLAALVGGLVMQHVYTNLALSGRLGTYEQAKASLQTGDYGLLVGARKDSVFLVTAILASPLVGAGADAPATVEVKTTAARWLNEHGYGLENFDYYTLLRPDVLYLHSEFLGAWVTAGILAVPFWLLALVLLWRAMLRAMAAGRLAESFLLVMGLWHIAFSPIGDITRVHLAVMLGIAVSVLSRRPPDAPEPRGEHDAEAGGDRDLAGSAADRAA